MLNGIVATQKLRVERAELGYQLAIKVALADPALGLDEAKIDVDPEQGLDLRPNIVGQFSPMSALPPSIEFAGAPCPTREGPAERNLSSEEIWLCTELR